MSAEDLRVAARALAAGGFVEGHNATLARRQRRELAALFRDELGWQVIAEDHGSVRALCQPGAGHVPRGLMTRSGRPFDGQRYALLFLVLAGLEAAGSRTTLKVLFEEVRSRAADIDALAFDHNLAAHRRAFVHAVQAATDLGVLDLADNRGEETFATGGEGDALYRVERSQLTRLLATSKPPSLAATPAAAVAENLYSHTDDGQRRQRRHRITRALVAEPVLYRSDLTADEADYLTGQEARIRRLLAERFGLTLETRAQGWVAVDTEGTLTDQRFPAISVSRAAGLAIVDESRARRGTAEQVAWSAEDLHRFVAGLGSRFGASWTVDAEDADAVDRVTVEAGDVLVAMRLARRDGSVLVVLAAAGRFAMTASADTANATGSAETLPIDSEDAET